MDCTSVLVAIVTVSVFVPVLELPMEFMGPGKGEFGLDGLALRRDTSINQSTAYGLRVRGGYHFTGRFQLEGLVAGAIDEEALCTATILLGGAFAFRPGRKVEPYVALAAGQAAREVETATGYSEDSGLAGHLMVGSRFFFSKAHVLALRVEGGMESENTFGTTTNHATFALGITWRMGVH